MVEQTPQDDYADFPGELKGLEQWVVWVLRSGKKIPVDPKTGKPASSTDPSTWSNFHAALSYARQAGAAGIGFVLIEPNGITVVDLDKCRDPKTEIIQPWAVAIIRQLNSYTEISPSGTGVHIWTRAKVPPGGNRHGRVEMYTTARYMTVTGQVLRRTE